MIMCSTCLVVFPSPYLCTCAPVHDAQSSLDVAHARVATRPCAHAREQAACATKFCYQKNEDGSYGDVRQTCTAGNWYGPDGFVSSGKRSSRDDNGKAIRDKFGKGGPPGWRKDGLSKVKLEPEFGKIPMDKGVISMRRFGNPDSAGSQFIINMSDMKDEMEGTLSMWQGSGRVAHAVALASLPPHFACVLCCTLNVALPVALPSAT
jgi:hypothetical protein